MMQALCSRSFPAPQASGVRISVLISRAPGERRDGWNWMRNEVMEQGTCWRQPSRDEQRDPFTNKSWMMENMEAVIGPEVPVIANPSQFPLNTIIKCWRDGEEKQQVGLGESRGRKNERLRRHFFHLHHRFLSRPFSYWFSTLFQGCINEWQPLRTNFLGNSICG